jgi:hypothetical protein
MRTITRTIDIAATPEQVWSVLTDTAGHTHWNPFITKLAGDLQIGSKIEVRVVPPGRKPMTFHPTVTESEANRKLAWLGHLLTSGLFDGAHSFTLEPLDEGGTRVVQSETFGGALAWFAAGLARDTAAGFDAMNRALRDRVGRRDEDHGPAADHQSEGTRHDHH